jgi:hypothetical protein
MEGMREALEGLLDGWLWNSQLKLDIFESSTNYYWRWLSTWVLGATSSHSFMGKLGVYWDILQVSTYKGIIACQIPSSNSLICLYSHWKGTQNVLIHCLSSFKISFAWDHYDFIVVWIFIVNVQMKQGSCSKVCGLMT